eukprot:TRINITY_DN8868_c0_g1_i1.p1 TRINITY_DN8868_c0_g1~~TRINITY_DN8868_c0_g1_i1.p1  ORF type:complete len:465 (+),score=49.17 TRINITY_DN8868_c0_g1_i1:397-1791(+)
MSHTRCSWIVAGERFFSFCLQGQPLKLVVWSLRGLASPLAFAMTALQRLYSRLHPLQVAAAEENSEEPEYAEPQISASDSSGESSDVPMRRNVRYRLLRQSKAGLVFWMFGMLTLTLTGFYVAARARRHRHFRDIRAAVFPTSRGVPMQSFQSYVCQANQTSSCTGAPSETCYRDDDVCSVGGLGCNAGGQSLCRFCGFGPFVGIRCPASSGKPSPFLPPAVSPTLPPGGSRERLIIVNGCHKGSMHIASFAGAMSYFEQNIRLRPGEAHGFAIPNRGLAATRFWPKWGCDAAGEDCSIGQSGGPGESCPAHGCAPPIDSKFEATFGCFPEVAARKQCSRNPSDPVHFLDGSDWWDVSQVDGWTLPYKVEVSGHCSSAPSKIDCSHLNLSSCPPSEYLGRSHGAQDLRLHSPADAGEEEPTVVGCFSPCGKLTYRNWGQGFGHAVTSPEARDFPCVCHAFTVET